MKPKIGEVYLIKSEDCSKNWYGICVELPENTYTDYVTMRVLGKKSPKIGWKRGLHYPCDNNRYWNLGDDGSDGEVVKRCNTIPDKLWLEMI
jgi:hypothetical protein